MYKFILKCALCCNVSNFFFQVMCKIYYYIWNVSYISSIIILTVIATERYIAILHPLKARHFMTSKRLVFVQAIIWFVSLIYNIPFLIFYDTISFSESGKEYCYSSFEHMESLKWMSLLNLIIWYVIPLLLIGFMYYRVARALWQTTIASALRLQPHSNADEVSFHRTSTRLSNVNNETCQKETLNKTEPPSANASDDNSDKLQIQQWSSDDSHNSEKAVFTYKGNHEFTVVYSLRQNGEASPYKLRCFFPTTQSEANDEEMTVKLSNIKGEMSRSNPTGSSFRHGKHRQTYLASSSRVAKARKKVIRLLIAVVISFCICVLPHMLKVLNHYWVVFNLPHDVETILSPISFIVLYLNSVLNPFMYAMFSTNFRRSFKETLPCFHQRKRSTEQGIK